MSDLQTPKYEAEYVAPFRTLETLVPPKPTRSFARLMLVLLVLLAVG